MPEDEKLSQKSPGRMPRAEVWPYGLLLGELGPDQRRWEP